MRPSLVMILAALAIQGASARAASAPASGGLALRIEPVTTKHHEVRFRLLLDNAGVPCHAVFVDPVLSAFALPSRPEMRVVLRVLDEQGHAVTPTKTLSAPAMMGARPEDLVLLDCGMLIGSYLDLREFGFRSLPSGRYRVLMTLKIGVRTFVGRTPGYFEHLMRLREGTRVTIERQLVDAELQGEATIVVR